MRNAVYQPWRRWASMAWPSMRKNLTSVLSKSSRCFWVLVRPPLCARQKSSALRKGAQQIPLNRGSLGPPVCHSHFGEGSRSPLGENTDHHGLAVDESNPHVGPFGVGRRREERNIGSLIL